MKRIWGVATLVFLALCIAGALLWAHYEDAASAEKAASGIAVVVYGDTNSDRWKSLDQGIHQACRELGIEKPLISVARSGDAGRQVQLLQREVENGARGLLVVPGSDPDLAACLAQLAETTPVVLLESDVGDADAAGIAPWPTVSADNAAMGRILADHLAGEEGVIAVLNRGDRNEAVDQRYEAFTARMAELGKDLAVIQYSPRNRDLKAHLALTLATHNPRIDRLVVLDNDSLETAADAAPAAMVDVRICGIGCSEKVVHALDQGVVDAIVYQNEYAVGYLGIMALARQMHLTGVDAGTAIQYRLVTKADMYEPAVERLLFPIIQ